MEVDIGKGLKLEVPDFDDNAWITSEDHVKIARYIWRTGWHNVLMDSHASVTPKSVANGEDLSETEVKAKVQTESLKVAQTKLEALLNGELRVARTGGERLTDEERIRKMLVRQRVMREIKNFGRKAKEFDAAWFKQADAVVYASIGDEIDREVNRLVSERAKSAKSVDLKGLGL